jgi:hypothetical protein
MKKKKKIQIGTTDVAHEARSAIHKIVNIIIKNLTN